MRCRLQTAMAPAGSGGGLCRAAGRSLALFAASLTFLLAACAQERPQGKALLQVSVQPVAQVAAVSSGQEALAGLDDGFCAETGSAQRRPEPPVELSPTAYTFRDVLRSAGCSPKAGKSAALSAVPLHALASSNGGREFTVHVVSERGGRAFVQARTVTVASVAGDMVTILSGVVPGELIITSGTALARDGQEVRYIRN